MKETNTQFMKEFKNITSRLALDDSVLEVIRELNVSYFCLSLYIHLLFDFKNFIYPIGNYVEDNVADEEISVNQSCSTINQKVNQFITWKRTQINQSNLSEFLSRKQEHGQDSSCQPSSRIDMAKINRNEQIKTAVVENWEGPLDRSTNVLKENISGEGLSGIDSLTRHLTVDHKDGNDFIK